MDLVAIALGVVFFVALWATIYLLVALLRPERF